MKLSIIVPVFNEINTINKILKKVIVEEIPGVEKEIIVVDDGSTDGTREELKKNQSSSFKLSLHAKNKGKGAAVLTGIKISSGDYIIIQDSDLEYDPKYIKDLTVPILEGRAKVVYGTRIKRLPNLSDEEKSPRFLLHYFGNRFLSLITSFLYGQWITDMETGYKLFPRIALKRVKMNARGFEFEPEITAKLLKRGYKILEIPIKTVPRSYEEGKKISALKDGGKALWYLFKYRFLD